ncbi:unnamed protein product [Musa acuminata subsp. malaccensis]|uniref:(wild Malaysian banana) hypothetical protein n=1 Tax=Musa acuminata subsp. malaccensis TaxID=214687 RepID=A0A804IHY9_MUSAM|nr:unnamed protein product [Musa acuminata subsp. malaccensis]
MLLRYLLLLLIPSPATSQSWQPSEIPSTATNTERRWSSAKRLGNPLMTGDGRLLACSGMNLLCFDKNGTIAWIVPFQYTCRLDVAPVNDDRGKIYLVAEDRVLRITPPNIGRSASTVEVFFGTNSTFGSSGEIIGISISILYASVFVSVRNRGLFALLPKGELLWTAGPMLYRFGYRQGCKRNITDCYFNSVPVVDQCEGTLYVSNTEGQVYSLYIRSPHFRWIQDFSSIDKKINIIPGNNGHLYLIFPRKAVLMSLDVATGNMSWRNNVGPLSAETILPVVDSNGWLSIGSLDGYLYSFSPVGDLKKFLQKTASDSVIQATPVLDCSGFAVYVPQTVMEGKSSRVIGDYTFISALKPLSIVFTLLAPATGTVYWADNHHGEVSSFLSKSDLRYFELDDRILLTVLSAGSECQLIKKKKEKCNALPPNLVLYVNAGIGSSLPCYSAGQRIAWTCSQSNPRFVTTDAGNERAVLLFLFFQFAILLILGGTVRSCCVFWRKKKLQDHGLGRFLDKRRSLHRRRKSFDRMISELEEKAAEDATNDEALERLGEAVTAKEGVVRKLSTSYSLGRDRTGSRRGSILPLYDDGRKKSHSFHCARRESVTIFNTYSDTSSSDESRNSSNYHHESGSGGCSDEAGPSSRVAAAEGDGEGSSDAASEARTFANPMFVEDAGDSVRHSRDEELTRDPMQEGVGARGMWLKRRRTLSSTN